MASSALILRFFVRPVGSSALFCRWTPRKPLRASAAELSTAGWIVVGFIGGCCRTAADCYAGNP